jgi:hypothetical protein
MSIVGSEGVACSMGSMSNACLVCGLWAGARHAVALDIYLAPATVAKAMVLSQAEQQAFDSTCMPTLQW